MIRIVKLAALGLTSLLIVAIGSSLLFWLGRRSREVRGEIVVDGDLLADDPGVDVDGESAYS